MISLDYFAAHAAPTFQAFSQEADHGLYRFQLDEGGAGTVESFTLFPGIHLIFNDLPKGEVLWGEDAPRAMQIEHARRGRFEVVTADGKAYYLHEGECATHDRRIVNRQMRYPMPHYEGFTLHIEYDEGAASLARQDATRDISFEALHRKLAGVDGCRVFAPDAEMRMLLDSMYDMGPRARMSRMRCKALELVSLLDATSEGDVSWRKAPYRPREEARELQVALDLLSNNLAEPLSLVSVAKAAGLSLSTLKERFGAAFGITPMAYRRQCRLEEGARLLTSTTLSVSDVAAQVGYKNASKFSAAFQTHMNASPSEWRKSTEL